MLAGYKELGLAEKGYDPKKIIYTVLIFSCLLIAMSRDKVEDEFTIQIRLRAGFFAFVIGVGCFLMASINPFAFWDLSLFLDIYTLLFFMLMNFLVMKWHMTRKSKKEELD